MSDICCNDIVGGEIFIRAVFPSSAGGGSARYEGMGDVRIQPSGLERTAGSSSGGTLWVTEAARPVRFLLSFINRCKSDPMRLFKGRCRLFVTVIEKGRGIQHDFTDAIMVGLPEINLSTGEITGMEGVAEKYRTGDYSASGAQVGGGVGAEAALIA